MASSTILANSEFAVLYNSVFSKKKTELKLFYYSSL
jgi:hypothetical protein